MFFGSSTRRMFSPDNRVVQGRIQVLAWSVSFRRSDCTTTTGRTFPGSLPRRGFRSAAQSSPRRGERSGILETVVHQRIQLLDRLESRGAHARRSLAELPAKFLSRNGIFQQPERAANNLCVGRRFEQPAQSQDPSVFLCGQGKRRFPDGMRLHAYFIPSIAPQRNEGGPPMVEWSRRALKYTVSGRRSASDQTTWSDRARTLVALFE